MSGIKKSIRFTEAEFEIINKELVENKINFTSYAKKALIKKKITSEYTLEALNELNTISLALCDIAENVSKRDLALIIYQLVKIEEKIEALI